MWNNFHCDRFSIGLEFILLFFFRKMAQLPTIGNVNIGIIFYCIGHSQWCIYNTQSKSDWLFDTQSRVLQADWLILKNNEKATLNINMPCSAIELCQKFFLKILGGDW